MIELAHGNILLWLYIEELKKIDFYVAVKVDQFKSSNISL